MRTATRASAVAAALLAAVLAAAVPGLGADSGQGGAEQLVLRLPDVGRGYVLGDDSGCGGLGTENAPPSVAQVAVTYYPVYSCGMEFERLWRARGRTPARGALYVSSTAFVFAADEGIRAGFGTGRELAAYDLGLEAKDLAPRGDRPVLGDEASAFFVADDFALGLSDRPGVVVMWRQGRVLGIVHVVGLRERTAMPVALSLARRQAQRIAKPAPVPPGVNDDREVRLDDPHLRMPVHWLGLRFAPGRHLPPMRLAYIFGPTNAPDAPGNRASIEYEGRHDGVSIELWQPRRWAKWRRSKFSRGFWDRPCARRRTISVAHGHAVLFRSCAKRHARFAAHVYLSRAVLAVGPYCMRCDAGDGAYGSFKGLAAIARGLRLRRR